MSWKSIACLAAVAAITAPAVAQPTISLVDNGGSASLNITTLVDGSVGAEIGLTFDAGLSFSNVTPNLSDFEANPGDNIFVAGSPVGGDVNGLFEDAGAGQIFASYGLITTPATAGTYELLSFDYSGTGDINASGVVAQLGDLGEVLTDTLTITGGIFGDFEPDGDVDIIDFGNFADAFGSMTGDPEYNALADSEPDGDVDIIDFGLFADNFGIGTSSSSAVPEPAAALLGLIGLACLGVRRSV